MIELRLGDEYMAEPVFCGDVDRMGHIDTDDLPVSDDLKKDLHAWNDEYQSTFDDSYPPDSGFSLPELELAHVIKGAELAERLQVEMGADYDVAYLPLALKLSFKRPNPPLTPLRLSSDNYMGEPVRIRIDGVFYDCATRSLPVSDALKQALQAWFNSPGHTTASHVKQGAELAKRLQAEMGPNYPVEYIPGAVRSVGA